MPVRALTATSTLAIGSAHKGPRSYVALAVKGLVCVQGWRLVITAVSDTVPVAVRPKNEPLIRSVSVTVDPKWSTAEPENLPALIARVPKWNRGAVLPAPGRAGLQIRDDQAVDRSAVR